MFKTDFILDNLLVSRILPPLVPPCKGGKQENPVLFIKGETRKSSSLYKGEKQENPVLFIKGGNKKIQFSLYRGETRKSSPLYKGEKQQNVYLVGRNFCSGINHPILFKTDFCILDNLLVSRILPPLVPPYKGGKQENPVLFIQGRNKKIQSSL